MRTAIGSVVIAATALVSGGLTRAQQAAPPAPVDEEEQMDTALRKFGYVSGQAFQCYSVEQQGKVERTALDVATNIMRLFGSDRAFFYAAAFGAGASEEMDREGCPAAIKDATAMLERLKVLSAR